MNVKRIDLLLDSQADEVSAVSAAITWFGCNAGVQIGYNNFIEILVKRFVLRLNGFA